MTDGTQDKPEVAIVGAGIIGLACASYLQDAGFRVVLFDPEKIASGASGGNAGGFGVSEVIPLAKAVSFARIFKWVLEPGSPLSIRWTHLPRLAPWLIRFMASAQPSAVERLTAAMASLCDRTYTDYAPIMDGAHLRDLVRMEPALSVYRTTQRYQADIDNWDLRGRHGVKYRALDRAAIEALEPDISSAFAAGVLHEDWGHTVDPVEFTQRIARHVIERGGRIIEKRVVAIGRSGNKATHLTCDDGKSLPIDRLIIAAGAWSGRLTQMLGLRIPLETERGYHVMLPTPNVRLARELIHTDEGFVITPMQGGLRLAGTVELDRLDAPPNFYRAKILIDKAREIFPQLDASDPTFWMGNRPSLPDSLPVIGAMPAVNNVFLAFGHGHVGLTLAGVTARILRDLLCNETPPVDIRPFAATRFSTRRA